MAPRNTKIKKTRFLKCFNDPKNACSIQGACKFARINRSTYREWNKNDRVFNLACQDAIEALIDWGESKLYERMEKGSDVAVFFFLCNKGKRRGWQHIGNIEQQEREKKHIGIMVDVIEATPKQIEAIDVKQLETDKE